SNIEYGDAYIFFTCVYDSYNTIVSIVRPKNVPVPVRASASVPSFTLASAISLPLPRPCGC
ncbi:MAG: hypothetical protein QW578_08190, partial [Thermoplasmatales archaeon]